MLNAYRKQHSTQLKGRIEERENVQRELERQRTCSHIKQYMESKNCCIPAHLLLSCTLSPLLCAWECVCACECVCALWGQLPVICMSDSRTGRWLWLQIEVEAHGWVVLFDRVSVTSYLVFAALLLPLFFQCFLSHAPSLLSCINRSRHWTLNEGHQRQLHLDCFFFCITFWSCCCFCILFFLLFAWQAFCAGQAMNSINYGLWHVLLICFFFVFLSVNQFKCQTANWYEF